MKVLGDAIMFVAVDVKAACAIAIAIVERFADDANPVTPRGALAYGGSQIPTNETTGERHALEILTGHAGDAVVFREPLVHVGVIGVEEIEHAAGVDPRRVNLAIFL